MWHRKTWVFGLVTVATAMGLAFATNIATLPVNLLSGWLMPKSAPTLGGELLVKVPKDFPFNGFHISRVTTGTNIEIFDQK
jgi:hypothetical protein